jgi:hypothetical protein
MGTYGGSKIIGWLWAFHFCWAWKRQNGLCVLYCMIQFLSSNLATVMKNSADPHLRHTGSDQRKRPTQNTVLSSTNTSHLWNVSESTCLNLFTFFKTYVPPPMTRLRVMSVMTPAFGFVRRARGSETSKFCVLNFHASRGPAVIHIGDHRTKYWYMFMVTYVRNGTNPPKKGFLANFGKK